MGQIPAPAPRGLAAADAGRVRKALAGSLAENTRRAYLGHWAAFGDYRAGQGFRWRMNVSH